MWLALVSLACVVVAAVAEETGGEGDGQQGFVLQEHSLQSPFPVNMASWEAGYATVVLDDMVRLTPAKPSRRGSLWNLQPLHARDWEISLTFRVHGPKSPGADGMALWYVSEPSLTGPTYGGPEHFKGLGIILDTFDNDGKRDNPKIQVVYSTDGTIPYDMATDGQQLELASCISYFRNLPYPARITIRYQEETLSVYVNLRQKSSSQRGATKCAEVTGLYLPQGYYLGLTAETGGLFDYHDIHGLTVTDISPPEATAESDAEEMPSSTFSNPKFLKAFRAKLERLRKEAKERKLAKAQQAAELVAQEVAFVEATEREENDAAVAEEESVDHAHEADHENDEDLEHHEFQESAAVVDDHTSMQVEQGTPVSTRKPSSVERALSVLSSIDSKVDNLAVEVQRSAPELRTIQDGVEKLAVLVRKVPRVVKELLGDKFVAAAAAADDKKEEDSKTKEAAADFSSTILEQELSTIKQKIEDLSAASRTSQSHLQSVVDTMSLELKHLVSTTPGQNIARVIESGNKETHRRTQEVDQKADQVRRDVQQIASRVTSLQEDMARSRTDIKNMERMVLEVASSAGGVSAFTVFMLITIQTAVLLFFLVVLPRKNKDFKIT